MLTIGGSLSSGVAHIGTDGEDSFPLVSTALTRKPYRIPSVSPVIVVLVPAEEVFKVLFHPGRSEKWLEPEELIQIE
jgi:hypothetical protein